MEIPKLPDSLRTEEEIIACWKGDITKPLVSVRCMTYNHAPYIEDAIKGFLIQETNFPIEVWIHDDASLDGTSEIVKSYQKKYPKIIKTILQQENQYSKGIKPSSFINPHCSGKYYAFCEGDDFWYDPKKLQKQFEIMEERDDIDLCIHSAYKLNMIDHEELEIGKYLVKSGVVSISDIILKRCGQIPTASTFIRRELMVEIYEFKYARPYLTVGDIYLHFFGAKRGGAFYIDEPMSVYRAFVPGSWTQNNLEDYSKRITNISARVNSYIELDELTRYKYHSAFFEANRKWVLRVLKDYRVPYKPKIFFYRKYVRCLSLKDNLIFFPIVVLPGAFSLSKAVKKKVAP